MAWAGQPSPALVWLFEDSAWEPCHPGQEKRVLNGSPFLLSPCCLVASQIQGSCHPVYLSLGIHLPQVGDLRLTHVVSDLSRVSSPAWVSVQRGPELVAHSGLLNWRWPCGCR